MLTIYDIHIGTHHPQKFVNETSLILELYVTVMAKRIYVYILFVTSYISSFKKEQFHIFLHHSSKNKTCNRKYTITELEERNALEKHELSH